MSDYRINIMRGSVVVAEVTPASSSSLKRSIMQDSEFSFNFSLPSFVNFKRGDRIGFKGEQYVMDAGAEVKKNSKGEYEYSCTFKGESIYLSQIMFFFLDLTDSGGVVSANGDFSVTCDVADMLKMIVANLNRTLADKWDFSILATVDTREEKTMTFSDVSCRQALDMICEEFGVEWELKGRTIRIGKKIERNTSISLTYPESLLSPITIRRVEGCFTRLYVKGGERNIPKGYKGGSRLSLPSDVAYIERTEQRWVKEEIKLFDEVYPRLNSCVKSASKSEKGYWYIKDNNLDFNIKDHLAEGVTAKICFNSGKLSGITFEIASFDFAMRMIEIKQQTIDGVNVPNDDMYPQVGDDYVLLDILMPQSYIERAESELYDKAIEYFEENAEEKQQIDAKVSTIYLIKSNNRINPHDIVRVCDMGVDRRIRVTETVEKPFSGSDYGRGVEVTLSDFVTRSRLTAITSAIVGNYSLTKNNSRSITNISNTTTNEFTNMAESVTWNFG